MPQNFAPRKIISTIRKRKHIPDAHLQELERLIKDTDNFKHFTETQKNDLIYLNRKSQRVNRYHSNQKMIGKKTTMKKGGKVVDDNTAMVLSQNKAIAHHTEELGKALNKNERVDAWVVGKMERASTDISDVTHYIDGKTEYADGGNIESKYVVVETDKMGKKRIMGTYYDLTSAEVYAMMKNDFMLKGRSVSIEDGEGKIVKRYEKGGEIEMTPLVGKDGERRIDAKAIDRLEMLARELPQTKYANIDKNGRYIPKRKQLHKKIVDGFKKNKPCITNRQPIAILTGGAPASGKSTFIKKYVDLDPDKVYHIDADEVRAMLPEYKGWNASQTHLETSDIVTKLIDSIGVPCEFDLIYDGTMNRADKYTDLVNKLHNFGYKVFIIYISIPKELSIERSRERYKKSGRYVPKEVIDKVYSTGLVAFEDVAKNMADGYVRIDGVSGDIIEKGGMEMPKNIEYGKGGKIGFEGLSDKVAKNYEGKSVKPEYRKLYGKTYSKEEAKEVGDKVASKVYRQQIAKMEMGGEVGDNALVVSANKMGYIVEVGNDTYTLRFPDGTQSVFRESELQIMNDDEYFADGGDTNKQWVVYVNNDQNIIGTYDSERLAKRMMKEAWNSGDYESVGMGLKSDAYSEEYYAKGGYMEHRGTITDDSLESILKSDFPNLNYQTSYNEINGYEIYGQKDVVMIIQKHLLDEYGIISEYVKETFGLPYLRVYSQFVDKETFEETNGDKMAKGGDTSKYNYGRSWHMDKRKFNKSENYELPMNTRKKEMGGDLSKDYEEWEMVVLTKDENGKSHNYRFLVSARNIAEAKEIATDLWNNQFADMNETLYKVMSDAKYRMDYGMADGGEIEPKQARFDVTIYDEDDEKYYLITYAEDEEDAIRKAENWHDIESVDSDVMMITDYDGKNLYFAKGGLVEEIKMFDKYNYPTPKTKGDKVRAIFEHFKKKGYSTEEINTALGKMNYAKGGTIKVGDKVRSTTFDGVEGEVVSKKGDMLFIVKNNASSSGDMQHDVLRIGEVEKMSMGGYMADGGELKKGDKIVVLGKEFEFVRHEMDSSQGYDEERVILKNEDGIRSYPKDMVEAYSKYKMADGGYISSGKKLYDVANTMSDKEFQDAYRKLSEKEKDNYDKLNDDFEDGGEVQTILAVPKYMRDEIEESINMGYDELVVGMISKNRKGVLLVNDNYQVRGTYDMGLKNYIENIIENHKTKKAKGGMMADGGEVEPKIYEINDGYHLFYFYGDNKAQVLKYFKMVYHTNKYEQNISIRIMTGSRLKHFEESEEYDYIEDARVPYDDEDEYAKGGYMADGGLIKGLNADEFALLYVKRAIKSPYRDSYLKPIGLWQTPKAKEVEKSLISKGLLLSNGAITSKGKDLAKDIDVATNKEFSSGYLGTMSSERVSKFERVKQKFDSYAKGGQTNTRKYNIIDEGKVVESSVSESKVIDYANTLAFYDLMDESETGDVKEIANFQDALNYLGMVDVEVLEVAGEGSELSKKNLYTFENLGTFADEIEFILDVNDIQFNTKGESIVAVTTSDKIKVVIGDIDNLDEPEAKDIVIRTANKVLHGKYVEPTKKLYTSGMSEKTAERILKKLGVVGNAPMNEEQKSKKDERNAMVLFTPAIDKKLFEQYEEFGGDISQQDVVVKIFNPFGSGTWYIINSDPKDPNYLWGIVDLFEVEMGSISRDELVSLRIPPLGVKLERDLSFKPINAQELFTRLQDGENFKFGGNVEYKQKDFDNTIQ